MLDEPGLNPCPPAAQFAHGWSEGSETSTGKGVDPGFSTVFAEGGSVASTGPQTRFRGMEVVLG